MHHPQPSHVCNEVNINKWLGWTPFREECIDCNVLPLCMGDCPYRTLYHNQLMDASKNVCAWWKYNLIPMLRTAKVAKENGLLNVSRLQSLETKKGGES